MKNEKVVISYMHELGKLLGDIVKDKETINSINRLLDLILNTINNKNKIVIAGNGGSASDAQHFVTELVVRYKVNRKAINAIAINTDSTILTAIGNDYEFTEIFARQIEAIGSQGDLFIPISTSGNSKNLINACKMATTKKMISFGLIGKDGGELKNLVNDKIIVPSDNTARIQEIHILIIHILCEELEKVLGK